MPRKHGFSSGVQKLIVSPVESLQIRDDLQVRQEDLLEDSNIALNKHKRGSCQRFRNTSIKSSKGICVLFVQEP